MTGNDVMSCYRCGAVEDEVVVFVDGGVVVLLKEVIEHPQLAIVLIGILLAVVGKGSLSGCAPLWPDGVELLAQNERQFLLCGGALQFLF